MNWNDILSLFFGFVSFIFIVSNVVLVIYRWFHKKRQDNEHRQAIRDFESAIETAVGRINGYADMNLQNVTNVVSAARPRWRAERKQLVVDQIRVAQGVNLKILELLNESPRSSFPG